MKKYSVKKLGMGGIKKESFISLFGEKGEEMRRQAIEALASHGLVYGAFDEDNKCVCCFAFRRVKDYDMNGEVCTAAICEGSFTAVGHEEAVVQLREQIRSEIDDCFTYGHMGCRVVILEDETYDFCKGTRGEGTFIRGLLVFIVFCLIFHKVFLALILTLVFGNFILSLLGFRECIRE